MTNSLTKQKNIIKNGLQILAAICLSTPALFAADPAPAATSPDYAAMRAEVEALAKLTQAPKYEAVERPDATPNLKPIFYSGLNYQGKPTTVFAWLGVPEKREGKVPAVVLVHGGGGAASKEWVKNWNNQGYAAISMSLEGITDEFKRFPEGGPARVGIFGDSSNPIKDQWMYHAVADATLAAALLRSLPEVDPNKVGIVGCSWGGIITSTVIGIDPRYAFAIPVYGCGGLSVIPNQHAGQALYNEALANNEVYKKVWDANLRLDRARMPILWLSWPHEPHFPMDAFNLSRKKAGSKDSLLCLVPGLGHGNLTGRPEWFAFADSVLQEGRPWIREKSSKLEGGKMQAIFDSTKPLESASLVSTTDTGHTGGRRWIINPATLSQNEGVWVVDAAVPEGTTACFLNVKTGPLTASSDYFQNK
ncbi:MAG: dipeptidyl aminopeptidase [Spartobacteria bacterium]|nr:dipeptidyl aminopeptidase [Spartobacteria bacterium]